MVKPLIQRRCRPIYETAGTCFDVQACVVTCLADCFSALSFVSTPTLSSDSISASHLMESTNKQKNNNATWLSVPQFGDWEQQGQVPDYSLDFSKIRETRKQNKSRASRGNERELYAPTTAAASLQTSNIHRHHHEARSVRRSILSYFNCCAKA